MDSNVSNIHELMIFNKSGLCLYHHDMFKSKKLGNFAGLISPDNQDKKVVEKRKLVFGLLWSLKSFAQMVSCDAPS